jgi:hypothetical protein
MSGIIKAKERAVVSVFDRMMDLSKVECQTLLSGINAAFASCLVFVVSFKRPIGLVIVRSNYLVNCSLALGSNAPFAKYP